MEWVIIGTQLLIGLCVCTLFAIVALDRYNAQRFREPTSSLVYAECGRRVSGYDRKYRHRRGDAGMPIAMLLLLPVLAIVAQRLLR